MIFDVARLKARVRDHEWAAGISRRIAADARAWIQHPIDIPARPTGWAHHYFDPRNGTQLVFDRLRPDVHVSPVDGAAWRGEPYDGAWVYHAHSRISEAVHSLALAAVLTNETEYSREAARLLTAYADMYAADIVEPGAEGRLRLMGQSLDEAVWVIPLLHACQWLRADGLLDDRVRRTVADRLFVPLARRLMLDTNRIHNIHCWHNAAIALVGEVVQEDALIDFAVSHPVSGMARQVADGIRDDGFWYEGSIVYHFYTIAALQHLIAVLRAKGESIPGEARVRSMYLAPLIYADPALGLPAQNDGWEGASLYDFAPTFYEVAAGWWGDAAAVGTLQQIYASGRVARATLDALLYGPDSIDPGGDSTHQDALADVRRSSHSFAQSGLTVLRRRVSASRSPASTGVARDWPLSSFGITLYGMGEPFYGGYDAACRSGHLPERTLEPPRLAPQSGGSYVLFKHGPHGGGHGHPDKLSFVVYGLGEMLSRDLGTSGYGIPLNAGWYKQSVSHNTVVVDETSQQPAEGELLHWQVDEDFVCACARAGAAYDGVALQRTLVLTDDVLVVVDDVDARGSGHVAHTMDWVYHAEGEWAASSFPTREAEPFSAPGYEHLNDVRRAEIDSAWHVEWRSPRGQAYRLWMPAEPGTEVFQAIGPGNPATESRPCLVVRRRGIKTRFCAVFDLSEGLRVQGVALRAAIKSDRSAADGVEVIVAGEYGRAGRLSVTLDPGGSPYMTLCK